MTTTATNNVEPIYFYKSIYEIYYVDVDFVILNMLHFITKNLLFCHVSINKFKFLNKDSTIIERLNFQFKLNGLHFKSIEK